MTPASRHSRGFRPKQPVQQTQRTPRAHAPAPCLTQEPCARSLRPWGTGTCFQYIQRGQSARAAWYGPKPLISSGVVRRQIRLPLRAGRQIIRLMRITGRIERRLAERASIHRGLPRRSLLLTTLRAHPTTQVWPRSSPRQRTNGIAQQYRRNQQKDRQQNHKNRNERKRESAHEGNPKRAQVQNKHGHSVVSAKGGKEPLKHAQSVRGRGARPDPATLNFRKNSTREQSTCQRTSRSTVTDQQLSKHSPWPRPWCPPAPPHRFSVASS